MEKAFKTNRMLHACKKCGGKSVRSEVGYKVANGFMGISAIVLSLSFFGLFSEQVGSIAIIFLIPSTAVIFYYMFKKEGDYKCIACGNIQKDKIK